MLPPPPHPPTPHVLFPKTHAHTQHTRSSTVCLDHCSAFLAICRHLHCWNRTCIAFSQAGSSKDCRFSCITEDSHVSEQPQHLRLLLPKLLPYCYCHSSWSYDRCHGQAFPSACLHAAVMHQKLGCVLTVLSHVAGISLCLVTVFVDATLLAFRAIHEL